MVTLERFAYTPMGTFGRLRVDDRFECFSVERPWQHNEPGTSCIPEGAYPLVMGFFHHGGYSAYEITHVVGRSAILIHKANTMDELRGCVAPGMRLGFLKGRWAVLESAVAFDQFMKAMLDAPEDYIDVTFKSEGP